MIYDSDAASLDSTVLNMAARVFAVIWGNTFFYYLGCIVLFGVWIWVRKGFRASIHHIFTLLHLCGRRLRSPVGGRP